MTRNTSLFKKIFNKSELNENPKRNNDVSQEPAEFETAVSALGYGKFNFILLLIIFPSQWATMFETTITSYISPVAECDLDLSLNNKGLLNATPFIGAIVGGIFWGYLLDLFGRKKLLAIGFILEGIIVIITGFSQNFTFLTITKFFGGVMVGGLYIALCTYLSEFHSMEHRGKIQMILGFVSGCAQVFMPLFASFFLTLEISLNLFNGSIKLHAWNLYIIITSASAILAGIFYCFLPESPKFLMSKGDNEAALQIFKRVYSINSGQPEENYPIQNLIIESTGKAKEDKNTSCFEVLKNGLQQMFPLFGKLYLVKLILVTIIETLFLASMNTLRLWLPQIFQAIHEYQSENNGSTVALCTMLEGLTPTQNLSDPVAGPVCNVNLTDSFAVYLNSMIIAITCMVFYALAGTFINLLGRKILLGILGITSGICGMAIYFSQNTATTLVLSSLNLAAAGVCFDIVLTMTIVIFPTTLRAMAISITLMIGRSGAILGNIIFPILLQIGCAPPFIGLGAIVIVSTLLCLLLPNTDKYHLK